MPSEVKIVTLTRKDRRSVTVMIRPARAGEADACARLAYRSYSNRYFDPAVTDGPDRRGGSLRCFEFLIPDDTTNTGQCLKFFQQFWGRVMRDLEVDGTKDTRPLSDRYFCFVAEELGTGRILGFVKGYGRRPLSSSLYDELGKKGFLQPTSGPGLFLSITPRPEEIAEEGSLYIDPDYQRMGIGRLLRQAYTRRMRETGAKAMIVECYAKNDSKRYDEMMGAVYFADNPIPNGYLNARGEEESLDIPGKVLYWNPTQFDRLCTASLDGLKRLVSPPSTSASTSSDAPQASNPS